MREKPNEKGGQDPEFQQEGDILIEQKVEGRGKGGLIILIKFLNLLKQTIQKITNINPSLWSLKSSFSKIICTEIRNIG